MPNAPPPPAPQSVPKRPFPFGKLLALATLGMMLLGCAGMCVACSGLTWYFGSSLTKATDQVFHEALADGDRDEAYKRADSDFREAYPEADVRSFARARPSLFDRAKLEGVEVRRQSVDDRQYVVLIAHVADEGFIAFYCKVEGSGKLALLGISPASSSGEGLDKAVPAAVRRLGAL